jgi:hypothetical protein
VSLLAELDAFYVDYRGCGELDAGVDDVMVWILCELRGQDGQVGGRGRRCPTTLRLTVSPPG